MFKKLIGDKQFYKRVFSLMIPIMVQNGIMQFVNMLDNIMVGQVGTLEMSGVAVANQLIFVFNLCIFGVVSGAGIFGAQFVGSGDEEGVRYTFRYKNIVCVLITLLCIGLFICFGESLIGLYLQGEGKPEDIQATLTFGKEYLNIMLIGLIPVAIVQSYSSTLRETGNATIPMIAGIIAVLVNLVLNYVLIFGNFGAPQLGIQGAAIATVISRFVELAFIALWTNAHKDENSFIKGAYKSLYIPIKLVGRISAKGVPLMLNETMWAAGMALLAQSYSLRGLDVVAANNISNTFFNVFSVAFLAVGASIGVILGQTLGAGKVEEAKATSYKLIFFSFCISTLIGLIYFFAAMLIPFAYNTTDEIRVLAMRLMQISALVMPLDALANATYFTMRSGGKAFLTFLFDSCYVWIVVLPVAFGIGLGTSIPILPMFAICNLASGIKGLAGLVLVRSGIWAKNIVEK
ncbi:MAG: MATE family efflux transporter [Clostridia bacterium]|nr:MATE family efflux transporter [Clostridia bacterium]